MNTRKKEQRLRDLFAAAVADAPTIDVPHVAEDEELLLRWVEGDLSDLEHATIIDHLADCGACRAEIVAMVRAGALLIPEIDEVVAEPVVIREAALMKQEVSREKEEQDPPSIVSILSLMFSRKGMAWTSVAIAASLLLVAWIMIPSGPSKKIAEAKRLQQSGDPDAAYQQLKQLFDQSLTPAQMTEAKQLFHDVAYVIAKQQLATVAGGNDQGYADMIKLDREVTELAGTSPQLLNLRIQAERGIPSEFALDQHGTLTDRVYLAMKSIPANDPATDKALQELRQAVEAFPDTKALLLNYGQLLVQESDYDEARAQFEKVLALDSRDTRARMGLGLVAANSPSQGTRSRSLEEPDRDYDEAVAQFEAVLETEPDNIAALLNAAICLENMDLPDEALNYLRRALPLTTDKQQRTQIEVRIEQLESPDGR